MKKVLAFLIVLCLAMGMMGLMACDRPEPEEPPVEKTAEEKLLEGRYVFAYNAGGSYGNQTGFYRFYEEKSVVGKVFFASFSGSPRGGTYTLEKRDYSYSVYTNRDDAVTDNGLTDALQVKGTAPYTITFYDFDGVKLEDIGFDGDYLYNDPAKDSTMYAMGMAPQRYSHDTDANSSNATAYEVEKTAPATVISLIADDDKTSTLSIYHNNTYVDLVGAMIEGAWTVAKNSDNSLTYTLAPKTAGDTGATLKVAADRKTAVYTPTGGSALAMTREEFYVSEVTNLAGEVSATNGSNTFDATFTLVLMDDGSCKVESKMSTFTLFSDTGTWAKVAGKVNFTFVGLGELSGTIAKVEGEPVISLKLGASGDVLGSVTLNADLVIKGDASAFEASVQYGLTGTAGTTACTLNLYDDGTAKLFASLGGNSVELDSGTWSMSMTTYKITVVFADEDASDTVISMGGSPTAPTFTGTYVNTDVLYLGNVSIAFSN